MRSKAKYIFLVSTMEVTSSKGKDTAGGLKEMKDMEFESIKLFFDALVEVYKMDGMWHKSDWIVLSYYFFRFTKVCRFFNV